MEKLVVIKTLDQLEELRLYLKDKEFVAYDTETTGVSKESEIIGFSLSAEESVGYYVVLSYWDVEQQKLVYLETREAAKSILAELTTKQLVMHNAVFDCWMTNNNFGIELMPHVHTDTMLLAHIVDENRSVGLKELGSYFFGEDARKEQEEMKASVHKNGGQMTKACYELYKADADLIARYGAKDAILTLKVLHELIEDLYAQNLQDFFYKDESMPLLRGPTYELNTTGLKIDPDKLQTLKSTLEADCMDAKSYIYKEITPHVKDKYPGTGKTNVFNIGSTKQMSWLLFERLGNEFHLLTDEGRDLCKALAIRVPYVKSQKDDFISQCTHSKDRIWRMAGFNYVTKKKTTAKKVGDYWNYLACGKATLQKLAPRYKWVERLLEYAKNLKLLNTYVESIQERMRYCVIRPSFLQHGTTSGRYSSKAPNFQNLPKDDKRLKYCIVSRPGKVFVGADYSQLEPRVFASFSGDERLLSCFSKGEDFYSVIGMEVFEEYGYSLNKNDPNSFATQKPKLRDIAKVIALSSTYGTTAPKMAPTLRKSMDEAQEIIDNYFEKFPSVQRLMLESHEMAKNDGVVFNLFGRPRRMPKAKEIKRLFPGVSHARLAYEFRNLLNLAINHRIQSTGASIMNRAAIACWTKCRALEAQDAGWAEVKIVLQVHDELILEGPERLANEMACVLKDAMENTVELPGVKLLAEPKIGKNLAELK